MIRALLNRLGIDRTPSLTDSNQPQYAVLFVCMGNICRSPTAEGVFRKLVSDAGLEKYIQTDSAGTHAYHQGSQPDRRAQAAAEERGYVLSDLRSRPINEDDFTRFDYIVAMDRNNLEILCEHAGEENRDKVSLFLDFVTEKSGAEVPDPYYGGAEGFQRVLDLVEEASEALLETLRPAINKSS